jgi:hypothetical protein
MEVPKIKQTQTIFVCLNNTLIPPTYIYKFNKKIKIYIKYSLKDYPDDYYKKDKKYKESRLLMRSSNIFLQ